MGTGLVRVRHLRSGGEGKAMAAEGLSPVECVWAIEKGLSVVYTEGERTAIRELPPSLVKR